MRAEDQPGMQRRQRVAADAPTVALVLGGLLVAACATVTATNLCLPSEAFARWERHVARKEAIPA